MKGLIFNIQHYSIHDGPGIRTTVFLKGCPLRCIWCSNPEGQEMAPEVLYNKNRCSKCYQCIDVCPHGAISVAQDGFITINRYICNRCKEHMCVSACDEGALQLVGQFITVEELMQEVQKDILFYRNSNGGVTLSGGEPTSQPQFTSELFKKCKEKGIHTVLDTCGYTSWESLKRVLEYTDLVLYDIKHIEPEKHKKFTGVSNEIILKNAQAIFNNTNVYTIIRIPIIPKYNDSKQNMNAIARFVKEIGGKEVNLLPYHKLGMGKYERLSMNYSVRTQTPTKETLEEIKAVFESQGLRCLMI